MRRDFSLPEKDQEFLEARGLPWEAVKANNLLWLVLHEFEVPAGYTVRKPQMAVQLPGGYPDVQIDMAYFHPALVRVDGRSIRAVSLHPFDGKNWQQWSRHRKDAKDWRQGIDGLESHVMLFRHLLEREFK